MNNKGAKSRRNRVLSWLINLAGILVLVFILYLGGPKPWQQMIQGDWRYVLAAFAVTLIWNLLATYRWLLIVHHLTGGTTISPFRYFYTYHMIGMLTGQVMPISIGMLGARPVALNLATRLPLKRSALSVLLDKLFDLILALVIVGPVALYLVGWIRLSLAYELIAGLALLTVVLIAWQYEPVLRWVGKVGERLSQPLGRMPVIGERIIHRLQPQFERLSREAFLSNSVAVWAFIVTLVMYALLSARLVYMAEAVRLGIPWHILAMSVAVTQLTLIFSITPGSLGFLEGGWAAVFTLAGLTLEQFTTFVIARRAYFLVFTVIGTLLAFAWIRESPAHLFRAVLSSAGGSGQGENSERQA